MDKVIKRTTNRKPLWEVLEQHYQKKREWKTLKTVCVVDGLTGVGKTTYLLEYFKGKKVFYFSFAGLEETLAEKLFAECVKAKTGADVSCWEDGFKVVSVKYRIILLDDLSAISTYKRFHKAFYNHMITDINIRPFIALIVQPTDDVSGLADEYDEIYLDYFSVPEVMKLFPMLSKVDILGLCVVSGGIPKIINDYKSTISFEDNLRNMLRPSSAFIGFMPELLSKYFRRLENYHHILYAIANGNHSVSEIGKFTGFTYNKCDNYLAGLISCRLVITEKSISKSGAAKTAYILANNYYRVWYLYIFKNRSAIQLGDQKLADSIVKTITGKEVHEFHLQKAFALANERIRWDLWSSFRITQKAVYTPETIGKGSCQYAFDAIIRNGEKAVFIKVFKNPHENCKKDELDKIQNAVMFANTYYDSHVFIFTKRRFSDYAVAEAARDDVISLVEVDRLKY